jgi:hypothetical protein
LFPIRVAAAQTMAVRMLRTLVSIDELQAAAQQALPQR